MESSDKILSGFLVIIFIIIGVIVWGEETDRIGFKCTKHAVITGIVEVNYRTSTVMTEDGTYKLIQPSIKDGVKICIEGIRYNEITKTNKKWVREDGN